jgi:hypothetical protein
MMASFVQNGRIADLHKTPDQDASAEDASPFALTKAQQAAAEHATDFDPPIYNVWKQQEKTKGPISPSPRPRKTPRFRAFSRIFARVS